MTVLHCSSPRAHVNSVSVTLLHLFLSGQLDRSVQCLVFNVHRPLSTGILRSWFSHSAHQPPTTPHSGVKVFAEETTRTMDLLLLIISTILIWTYLRWKYSHLLWRVWTHLLIIPTSDLSASVSPTSTSVCVIIPILLTLNGGFSSKLWSMICYPPFTLDISNLNPILWLMVQKNIQRYILC